MASNNRRGSKNNNPEGRNQYSGGVMDMARERPYATAAAAAAAVGAGVFLWSRRNQISDQISNLSDQIGEWTENMNFGGQSGWSDDGTAGLTSNGSTGSTSMTGSTSGRRSNSSRGSKSQAEISQEALTLKETGKPNA